MRNVIIIAILVMGLASCKTSQQITSTTANATATDSVVIKEVVKVDTVHIAADSVFVTVPLEVLRTDTVIKFKNQRSSVMLQVEKGNLKAIAHCDSLKRLVLSYENSISAYKKNTSEKHYSDKLKIVIPVPWYYKASFWILIIIIILGSIALVLKSYSKTIIPWS